MNPIRELGTLLSLIRLYARIRPTIVHHVTIKPIIYGNIAATLTRVPAAVSTFSGLGHMFAQSDRLSRLFQAIIKMMYRAGFRHSRQIAIFENPDDLAEMTRDGTVPEPKARLVLGVGIDVDEYYAMPEPDGVPVVVLASRMLRSKGVEVFVEAAKVIRSRGVRARLALCGRVDAGNPSGIPEAQLAAWAEGGVVEWWGWLPSALSVYERSSVVCLPTLYREGVPRVLMEAASCGRPIIATDVPGCREIVQQGINGLLVPKGDAVALADAIEQLVRDTAQRTAFGQNGREIVRQNFAEKRVMDATVGIYDELVSGIDRGGRPLARR